MTSLRRRLLPLVAWAVGLCAPALAQTPAPADKVYTAQVVRSFPHDPSAFTEGLLYEGGVLYESTGMVGRSFIRKSQLETGKVLLQRDLKPPYFGEGMVLWKGKVVQLTWQHQLGFTYRAGDFAPTGSFKYKGEGWALTKDDRRLIMSDGTDQIRFLNPDTLAETGRIKVTFRGQPVDKINELEWVKGEIFANIWQTDLIVRIDPRTGRVVGRVNLEGLPLAQDRNGREDVLNGIAYDAKADRLLVTGKQWSKIYQIKLTEVR
jgi:glutaminyl-peptide cyclotransferase